MRCHHVLLLLDHCFSPPYLLFCSLSLSLSLSLLLCFHPSNNQSQKSPTKKCNRTAAEEAEEAEAEDSQTAAALINKQRTQKIFRALSVDMDMDTQKKNRF